MTDLLSKHSFVELGARQRAKALLYPGTSLHKVNPVTRGARYASFFWTQSLVREDSQRALLFEMDGAIQALTRDVPDHPSLIRLTGTYHNLLRRWVEV